MDLQPNYNIQNYLKSNLLDKLVWLLTVFAFSSIYIFENYIWGKYVFAGITIACFFLTIINCSADKIPYIGAFHIFILTFALYCGFNALWSVNMRDTLSKFSTILQILILFSILYFCFQSEGWVSRLLDAVMWTGYIIAIYSLFAYGGTTNVISMLKNGIKLENDYSNVNSIGMISAFACILQFNKILYKKISLSVIFTIPAFIIIIATQSRKALVLFVLGILAVLIFKSIDKRDFATSFVKVIFVVLAFILIVYFASKLTIFDGINKRMTNLFISLTGQGSGGRSAWLREQFRIVGWEQFLKTPIGGMGLGCSYYLTTSFGESTYLHNNFIELLACGGIVGFIIYYSIYAFLFVSLLKYRKADRQPGDICLILLILLLIMDYGMVSYISKSTYFFFMIIFTEVRSLKKKWSNNRYESVKSS